MTSDKNEDRDEMDLDRAIELADNMAEKLAEFDEEEILAGRVGVPAKTWEDLAELMSILQVEAYYREEEKEVDFSNEDALDYEDPDEDEDDPTEEDWKSWRSFATKD